MQKPKFPWLVVPLAIIFTSIILPGATEANLVELTPAVTAGGIYDDNLDYNNDEEDELEDYAYNIRPELSLKYLTNVLELEGYAIVDFLRYIEETVFDRTNQEYGGKIDYNSTPRLNIFGDYRYLKDESINSRFRATGRISRREPITSHLANGGFQFDLTELTFIRPQLRFYKVIYEEEADNVDFETYSVQLPFNLRLKNQRDTLFLNPGYERFENEDDDTADSFSLTAGWSQTTSEKINFNIELGGRYTIQENAAGDQEDKWNGVLRFNLDRIGETSLLRLDLSNRLGVSTEGNLLNITRLNFDLDQRLTERFGFEFRGWVFYSTREQDTESDDAVFSYRVQPALYFRLTENHRISGLYEYTFQEELDIPGSPVTQRNLFAIFLELSFPQQWDF